MVDLNNMAMFVQIVDAGSFADAARRIGVPPNTLSRRITQLEESLEVRLLHRSTRNLALTAAGQSLYERCAPQLIDLLEFGRQFQDGNREPIGKVRVAAPADFFEVFLMSWVKDFLTQHPKVQLDFVLSDNRSDLIAEGIDVAVRVGTLPDSSLVARKIGTIRQVLAASPEYLQTHGVPREVEELADHACICSSLTAIRKTWQLVGSMGPVQIGITGQFHANTARAQMKSTLAGIGICLLPEPILRDCLATGQLVRVLPQFESPSSDVSLVYTSRRQIPSAVTAFVEHASAHLQTSSLNR